MTTYLLDNSVTQRLARHRDVRESLRRLLVSDAILASSDVSILEAGFSARSPADHRRIVEGLREATVRLPLSEEAGLLAQSLQRGLAAAGRWREVGTVDVLLAATAIEHRAVVVHYDADFDVLAEVEPRLRQQWIVPRGAID